LKRVEDERGIRCNSVAITPTPSIDSVSSQARKSVQ
jgi:hypothetical protein